MRKLEQQLQTIEGYQQEIQATHKTAHLDPLKPLAKFSE
jgi:hypothetical protein